MKVNNIQNINFQSKQRFVSQKTNEGIKKILSNMDEEAIIMDKEKAFMLKSVTVDEFNTLYDNRTSLHQPIQYALFDVGKKRNQLVINTENGEITDYHKSFFSTWKGILKKVSQCVDKMLEHFEDEKVVERDYLTVHGAKYENTTYTNY